MWWSRCRGRCELPVCSRQGATRSPPPCGEGSGVGVSERLPGAIHTSQRSDRASRRLRKEATFAERSLWKELRRLESFHFRRQAPMETTSSTLSATDRG